MRKLMFFRFGGNDPHTVKLIGAFVIFAALLMFLSAGAAMFESWDALKAYPNCIAQIPAEESQLAQLQKTDCRASLYNATAVQLRGDQDRISSRQFFSALVEPVARLFFWAVVFIVGFVIYSTGRIVVPIEEVTRDLPEAKPLIKKK